MNNTRLSETHSGFLKQPTSMGYDVSRDALEAVSQAMIATAGAFIWHQNAYLFALGAKPYRDCTPIYRLGGHRERDETGWMCAVREVQEEVGLQITLRPTPTTYVVLDGDKDEKTLETLSWPDTPAPWLTVAHQRDGRTILSVMYHAQAEGVPRLSQEVHGLIWLDQPTLVQVCHEHMSLTHFLHQGGKAWMLPTIDQSRLLQPLTQPRLLVSMLHRETSY